MQLNLAFTKYGTQNHRVFQAGSHLLRSSSPRPCSKWDQLEHVVQGCGQIASPGSPRSLSLSSYQRCSNPLTTSVALCSTLCSMSMSLLYWEAQNRTQQSRSVLPVLSRSEGSPPSTCWKHSSSCSPADCWLPLPQVCSSLRLTCSQGLFCKAPLQLGVPQPVLVHKVITLQVKGFAFPFVEHHNILVY